MIAAVKGKIFAMAPGRVSLDTGSGIVVEAQVPVSSYAQLKDASDCILYTVLKIRDEDVVLYGFLELKDKAVFEKLISISGVGGKTALSCLSAFSVEELVQAINKGNVDKLSTIPGIGKKTAQRIILELTGKLEFEKEPEGADLKLKEDLISALVNLGFPPRQVRDMAGQFLKENPEVLSFEKAFKQIMKKASRQ